MSEIRGEYWIQDGWVDFADGDVGDKNHEMIAVHHYASKHIDDLVGIANDLEVPLHGMRLSSSGRFLVDEEYPAGDAEQIREKIISAVENKEIEWNLPHGESAADSVDEYLQKTLKIDHNEYNCIFGNCDARLMVMQREGWIAVRSNNVELFGYDDSKRREIVRGIEEILNQEGDDEENDEEIDLSIYDHKTKRSWDTTLAELKGGSVRAVTLPTTTYNKPLMVPTRGMNLAQRQAMFTSESLNFKSWLTIEEGSSL